MEITQINTAEEALQKFNSVAKELNFPQLILVDPHDCIGQEKNARYFNPEVFQQLTENIKADGRLESVPLIYRHETEKGKYRIISGHHRIDGAKQAGINLIIAFLIDPKDKNEIISKQLSHNSLVGKDDRMILKELFNEIEDINLKMASGVQFELDKVDYSSLNFKIGTFQEVLFLFMPTEEERLNAVLNDLEKISSANSDTHITTAELKTFDRFAASLQKIKKIGNIKSNPIGLAKMVEICEKWISEQKPKEKQEKQTKKRVDGKKVEISS